MAPNEQCPRCGSPNPEHHPAVQFEGEVSLCEHPWHQPTAAEIKAEWEPGVLRRMWTGLISNNTGAASGD